jgi:hypothetical protein
MTRKYERDDDDDDDNEDEEDERPGGSSMGMKVLAAIGFMAIGAIVVPALWGLVAEAPNMRRYLRIMRM